MLTNEENTLLTQVARGTPGGELLRRYWHPICAVGELTEDRPKKRIKMLNEELVAFRDPGGGYGLIAERCSHRGASLYYGFVENEGIRCAYHGWLYDATGQCLEQPFEPKAAAFKGRINHLAYPVEELGGLLFGYLGPSGSKPLLPRWDILVRSDLPRRIEIRPTLHCNWLQAEENTADVTHTYFLHAYTFMKKGRPQVGGGFGRPFARFGFQPFEWGLLKSWSYEGERSGSGWGNLLVFPNMLRLAGAMHWRVPIDDTSTRIIRIEIVSSADDSKSMNEGGDAQDAIPYTYEASWMNDEGEYHMDTFSSQDGMAWETQGSIFDRAQEHLGASDRGIILLRQMLKQGIDSVQNGSNPMALVYDPGFNEYIDLECWIAERGNAPPGSGGRQTIKRQATDVFDDRHEEFEIPPDSKARQGTAQTSQ